MKKRIGRPPSKITKEESFVRVSRKRFDFWCNFYLKSRAFWKKLTGLENRQQERTNGKENWNEQDEIQC